ncbi:MAG: hypothetical protein PW786_08930 [Arachidicoccus sp.]|nr:hypothetical protein [Arachidicoccus sp.]
MRYNICIKIFLPLIRVCIYSTICIAQQSNIIGTVTDVSNKKFIERASITVCSKSDGSIISYTFSDAKGIFSISVPNAGKDFMLRVSMIGYAAKEYAYQSNIHIYNFELTPTVHELKEVFVKSPPIVKRSDTLSYNVASFANAQDRTIGDVLKKLPGVEVADDGTVSYNGKPINKFYIEGLDLLDKKYGIATNSITAKDVQDVQVLENHQPIKVLKDKVFSDNAAINLKLKDAAKSKWLGTGDIETGGTPFLWKAEGTAMNFAGNNQTLNTFKTNNAGQDVTKELKSLSIEDILNGSDNLVQDQSKIQLLPSEPPISKERSLFNKSWTGTSNFLHQTKSGVQFRTNITLTDDRQTSNSSTQTNYFLGDSTLKILETKNSVAYNKKLEAGQNINVNNKDYYLNNQLNAQAFFQNINVQTTGSLPNNQKGKIPVHFLENDFNLVKALGKHILKIGVFVHYASQPQSLLINIPDSNLQDQHVNQKQLFLHPNASYSFSLRNISLTVQTGIQYTKGNYNTNLSGFGDIGISADSLRNKYAYSLFQYYILPKLNYDKDEFHLSLQLPIRTFFYNENEKDSLNKSKENPIYTCPQLNISYQLNDYWKVNLSSGYTVNVSTDNLPPGYILGNYRSLNVGANHLSIVKQQSYSVGATYEDAVHELFFYFRGSYSPSTKNYLSNNYFLGYLNIINNTLEENTAKNITFSSRISKTIDSWKSTFSLSANYNISQGYLIQQDALLLNKNKSVTLSPKIDVHPLDWLILGYEGSFIRNKLSVSNAPAESPLNQVYQKINVGAIISKSWNFKFTAEHFYNQLTNNQSHTTVFSDFQIRFIPKKSNRWQYSISACNLFNQKEFKYSTFSSASSMTQEYKIRPLNILAGVYFNW